MARFNNWLAKKITDGVATMWCAYLFAGVALISFPSAVRSHDALTIVSWVAQTFLQLVLLSIIMVGQNLSSQGVEKMIRETHEASLGEFELAKEARAIADKELVELKVIAREMHQLLREGKN